MTNDTNTERKLVKHKFRCHQIDPHTKILIIGTFNPATPKNNADFFYSRQVRRPNELWKLLPFALGSKDDLTGLGRVDEKKKVMSEHHVDFIDVIEEVEVPADREDDVDDAFIDKYVEKWHDGISEMKNLTLDAACFARSTFEDIPQINSRIIEIEDYCKKSNIQFRRLVTPSPGYRPKDKQLKQREWTEFFKPFAKS